MPICGYCGHPLEIGQDDMGLKFISICDNKGCPSHERCPICGSNSVSIIYVPRMEIIFECQKCGNDWKKPLSES